MPSRSGSPKTRDDKSDRPSKSDDLTDGRGGLKFGGNAGGFAGDLDQGVGSEYVSELPTDHEERTRAGEQEEEYDEGREVYHPSTMASKEVCILFSRLLIAFPKPLLTPEHVCFNIFSKLVSNTLFLSL